LFRRAGEAGAQFVLVHHGLFWRNEPLLVDRRLKGRLEALFVAPGHHGRGIGRALVAHAAALKPVLDTEVNAQNGPAVGFYRALGFVETGRSPDDGEGRPYPIIRLRLEAAGDARTERGTHGSAVPRAHGPVAVPPDQAS